MSYQINFGNLSVAKSTPPASKTRSFRIAVLGDFSARANRGELETGEALAARKPLKVDCDNVDEVIERLGLKLALPFGDASLEVEITNLDDLHPDQLYGKLPIFSELSALRKRLKSTATFAKAAKEVQGWAGQFGGGIEKNQGTARGLSVPVDGKLSDFAQLVGRPSAPAASEGGVEDLLKQVVAPYVVAAKDPRQDAMVAAVDKALTAMMGDVLHHPDFQAVEALWRSVDFLVRRLETDTQLQIVLLDISAEELAA
ncbi:MAG TPA: type VI secretion system contractile sheath large subunit, partial [Chthoniobacter sp.]|nr:type VI secretion system contractile sheath large subunit [Chthoniobacter sp.]